MNDEIKKALFFMESFRKCGESKFLSEEIKNTAHLFKEPSSKVELDKYRNVLEKMENFERIYGVGSCLNIDDEAIYEMAVVQNLFHHSIDICSVLKAPSDLRAQAISITGEGMH